MRQFELPKLLLVLLAGSLLLASGCKNGRVDARALGITGAPDAFNIRTNEPLEVPKNLKTLPAPNPNALALQDRKVSNKVDQLLGVPKEAPATAGEIGLLQQTGGLTASNQIRDVLQQDRANKKPKKSGGLLDRFRSNDNPDLGDVALDTVIETENLNSQGVPINNRKHRIRRLRHNLPASIY